MPAIEVDGLSKTFQLHGERRDSVKERVVRGRSQRSGETFEALRDVSFDVERGTTFGLIGHNGSGKSTLLKMLAGVLRPTSGQVVVDGRVSALLELGAGFHGELTGRENIYLNGAILGLTRKQIDASIDRIIDFAGIGEFIDAPVKVYSSGMYVRLGFSIAVTVDPEILIVDEIIAVGDEEFQRKCFDHLYTLRRQGTTIVLVTHSMSVVTDLCDRALWLDHGEIKALGEARDIVEAYLTDVNQREADAAASDTRQTPGVIRLGSGEVRVQSVEFLDSSGAPRPFAVPAEPCTIRVHYTAHEPVAEATMGLAIVHETGVVIAGPNSGQNGLTYDIAPGDGHVDYHLDQLPLQPGEFWLTVAIHAKGKTYDHVDKGFRFLVRADHAVSEPGLARIFGQWGPLIPDAPAGGAAG